MEMEMEAVAETSMDVLAERLIAAAGALEQAADRLAEREVTLAASTREAELERLLAEAQATIATLKAGRKTLPAGVATLLARDGAALVPATLDAALVSLSVEQRIAVKAELLRAGLVG